ncbi:uncharacterized protein LOC143551249 [Bidens hawaiensis]|uniref:uncharacterized protein LOC143551249 n=1 Tax=Bidens hawaiensis TaxID=980011 RepID=UPI00404B9918
MGDVHTFQVTIDTEQDKATPGPSGFGGGVVVHSGAEYKPYLKLHFPRFSGDDPTAWLYQAEPFCDFQKVPEADQAELAALHLDGIALQWHKWYTKSRGPLTWAEFTSALLQRFGPTDFEDPSEAFSRLKQITTVAAYQEAFERISQRVDVFLLGCFIGGLKDEIRLEVKIPYLSAKPSPSAGLLGPGPTTKLSLPAPTPVRRISNNFIDQALVDHFGLTVEQDTPFKVVVAYREQVSCAGRVRGFSIKVQGHIISTDFFVLPVAVCPVVLGVQWLKTLGPVEIDYEKLTIGFHLAGSTHTLQGLKGSELAALKSHEAMGILGPAILLQINLLSVESNPTLNPCSAIQQVMNRFAIVFHEPTTPPPKHFQDHGIPLIPGARPVSARPYRQPYLQKFEIERQVRELLQQGLIRPSHSPFSSPVLLVKKSDGSWRFCIDGQSLNDITVKDKYPIPMIYELLDELHASRIYSKLDLRSGYHQIRVRDEDIHKTAFRTHEGHYEFVVMPFGLTNAPATFQCLMNDLFRLFLQTNKLYAKQPKCCFEVSQVHYLGHLISADGVAVEPDKDQSVLAWPTPTNSKGVRGFLGLAGPFVWEEAADSAFKALKEALTTTHTLGLPDWSIPFTVECDASGVGIGAVLTQHGKPLAFFSAPLKGSMLTL